MQGQTLDSTLLADMESDPGFDRGETKFRDGLRIEVELWLIRRLSLQLIAVSGNGQDEVGGELIAPGIAF